MAASDEVIRLLLDMGVSKENVQAVVTELDRLRTASTSVKDSYDVLDNKAGTYTITTSQVSAAEEKAVQAAVEQTRAQKALAAALEVTASKNKSLNASMGVTNSQILEIGRATQDFAQGGFAGIVNNLERIVGGSGPAAAGITILGTALLLALPTLKEWFATMTEGFREKIPGATDAIGKLTEAIKRNKEELDALKEKQKLTIIEADKYRDLVRETTALEQEQADARAARSVGQYDNKADRARASAFREAVGEFGGSEKLLEQLAAAGVSPKDANARVAAAFKGDAGDIRNILMDVGGLKGLYTKPEDVARQKQNDEMREEQKRIDAQARDRDDREHKEARDNAAAIAAAAGKDAAARKAAADKVNLRPANQGRLDEARQKIASNIQAQVMQQGGATANQAARLQRLQEQLGTKMPSMEETQTVMMMAQNQMVSNQATFSQRLAEAKRILAEARQINRQANQPPMNQGGPW